MGAGTLVLASLLWATAALPPDVVAMKDRAISIPIQFNPSKRHEIKELLLFVSTDQGRTWTQEARAKPNDTSFPYVAPQDGTYWFAICIIEQNGQRVPADVNQMPPGLKVVIDTQPPIVQLKSAEREGDDIAIVWNIQESQPNPDTMKLEYRPADDMSQTWTSVPITPAPNGQLKFRVSNPGAILVRISIQDVAGNQGQALKKVGTETTSGFAPSGPGTAVGPPGPILPPTGPTNPSLPPTGAGVVPVQPDPPPMVGPILPPVNRAETPTTRVEPPPSRFDPPSTDRGAPANMTPIARSGRPEPVGREPLATAGREPLNSTASPASGTPDVGPRPELRNTMLINSTQISLSYNISQFGPSGVNSAKLYITDNEGATWQYLTEDRTINSKLMTNQPTDGRISANLPGEGTFGFRLVIESGAGISKGAPVNGVDQPEMRVEVDLTAPEIVLYNPAPDPSKRDTLILRWQATDKNLHPAPIGLDYSETENGPWKKIASDVANTGNLSWRLPPRMPARVYLRVTARDLAGNISEVRSPQPQLIDLTKPEGHLTGIAGTRVQVQP